MNPKIPTLHPLSLKDAPALIERIFPAQKISAEAQKERKAGPGQTLTPLGSYWKGRKPLIMVRAVVLASLLPVTDDLESDLSIFERLMAIDDDAFTRREPRMRAIDIAEKIHLDHPWDFFDYSLKGSDIDAEEVANLEFPIKPQDYPGLTIRWKRGINPSDKETLVAQALRDLPYEDKVRLCKRPEECDPDVLYSPVWPVVNAHLAQFGIEADSFESLVEQLGILRYGHRPRVGDAFCGGGSIPFEAARIGCNVYASDLNPVGSMLTWGALNIIGASSKRHAEIEEAQENLIQSIDQEIINLGIEHNTRGDRLYAALYCIEVRCPQTGWMVPMLPSLAISKRRFDCRAYLIPDYKNKRFDIEIKSGVSAKEMEQAGQQGTVRGGNLSYELDGDLYETPIGTLRGDYRSEDGENHNRLRQWEKHDFKPRSNDLFQERLYCIQWITAETLGKSRRETYFAAVTKEDLDREQKIERIVEENLVRWQTEGLVPDMVIEAGAETTRLNRERGWRYWHQLFNPRHLLLNAIVAKRVRKDPALFVMLAALLNRSSRLTHWNASRESAEHVFQSQALNTFWNYPARGWLHSEDLLKVPEARFVPGDGQVISKEAARITEVSDIWVTDPPYADAVNYEEITEFFIAWLRKNPPAPFDEWTWDSRRALAIKGDGDEFRNGMVKAYKTLAEHMPDNGLQCVMFTHQDTSVWADMVSVFWAAGLRVVGAWYIATETSSALRSGGYVQGTVTLILRKRFEDGASFRQRLLPQIRKEVQEQIDSMMRLNEEARGHGETVFNDSDLQMAGYAAALKVLTGYSEVDGRDVTTLALQPRRKGQKTVVDEIVDYASEVANTLLIPERLKELNPDTWGEITGLERFYLRMLAIEQSGMFKLDNYQNFSKAFHVDYQPLMASTRPNASRLRGTADFKPRELVGGDVGGTLLSELLIAMQELLNDKEPKAVIGQLRSSLDETYFQKRMHIMAMAQYLSEMLRERRPDEAQKAEIIANRIRNEGF